MGTAETAILGYGCRLPGADHPDDLWRLLIEGRCSVSRVGADRWDARGLLHPDRTIAGTTYTASAGLLDNPFAFDAGFFGISQREAVQMDPQQRLLMQVTWEALEMAGIKAERLAGPRTGVFVGASSLDYGNSVAGDPAAADSRFMTGNTLSIIANRLAHFLDAQGPSYVIDTACSSALFAFHAACRAIAGGEIDVAVVGGVNLLLTPMPFIGFSRAAMLSPSGLCKPFDHRADGYVRAEGAVAFVIGSKAWAEAAGDRVRGLVVGSAVNSDGRAHALSVPNSLRQAELMRGVYTQAGVDPDTVAFFEAHGTGTAVGDPQEARAIGEALARSRRAPLPVGSIKSNIGHLEPAAGLAGLLKAQLALENGVLPPTLHIEAPNPAIAFDALNIAPAVEPVVLPAEGRPLVAGVNAFGFGGANAHVAIRQPDPSGGKAVTARAAPLLLTAASETSLRVLAGRWRDRLADAAPDEAAALVNAAAHRKTRLPRRLVVTRTDAAARLAALTAVAGGVTSADAILDTALSGPSRPVAFVFSGNGAQWPGMGRRAYAEDPAFRAGFDAFSGALSGEGGGDLVEALHHDDLEVRLGDAETAQPLLVAIQIGLVEALAAQGVRPDFVAGHSIGEVSAAWACGALDLTQAARLTQRRARCQRPLRHTGGMAAVLAGSGALDQLLGDLDREDIGLAADNSPRGTTVSGSLQAIDALMALARSRRVAVRRLRVEYPFHGPLMEQIRDPLLDALADIAPGRARLPFVSSALGEALPGEALDAAYWWRNARQPVLFRQAVQRLSGLGAGVFVEIGPQPMLQNYVNDTLAADGAAGRFVAGFRRQGPGAESAAQVAARVLAVGGALDEAIMFGPALPQGTPSPAYPWDQKDYRIEATPDAINILRRPAPRPFLGWRASEDGPWRLSLDSRSEPWLSDHRVDGTAVLPAAAFVELALAAAAETLGDGPIELRDFDILRPLPLDGQRMDVRTRAESGGVIRIESRPSLADDAWALNGLGTARRTFGAVPAPDRPAASARPHGAAAPDADLYAALAANGLNYGPAFARTGTPEPDGTDGLMAALIPSSVAQSGPWMLDPTALDAAFHLLAPLLARDAAGAPEPGTCYLPTRIGRLVLHAPGHEPTVAVARLARRGLRTVEAGFTLRDASGALVATVTGARFTAVRLAHRRMRDIPLWREALVPVRLDPAQPSAMPASWSDPVRHLDGLGLLASPDAEPTPAALIVDAACRRIAWDAARKLAPSGGVAFRARRSLPQGLAAALLQGLAALAHDGAYDPTADRVEDGAPVPSVPALIDALLTTAPDQVTSVTELLRLADAFERRVDPERQRADMPTAAWKIIETMLAALRADWPEGAPLDIAIAGRPPEALVQWLDSLALGRVTMLAGDTPSGIFDVVVGAFETGAEPRSLDRLGQLVAPGGLLTVLWPERTLLTTMVHAAEGQPRAPQAEPLSELAGAGLEAAKSVRTARGGLAGVVARRPLGSRPARPAPAGEGPAPTVVILADAGGPGLAVAVGLQEALSGRGCAARIVTETTRTMSGNAVVVLKGCSAREPDSPAAVSLRFAALRDALAALDRDADGAVPTVWIASLAYLSARPADVAMERVARVLANERPGLRLRCVTAQCDDLAEAGRELAQAILARRDDPSITVRPTGAAAPRVLALPSPPTTGRRSKTAEDGTPTLQPGLTGGLEALRWRPMPRRVPGPGEIEIAVAATGLNFRDVMWAMGMLPEEAIEDGFAGTALGMECAGTVARAGPGARWPEGTRVIAFAAGAFAGHVTVADTAAVAVPDGFDLAEVASLPVAVATAYRALVDIGRVAPGETVLVHGGAGAVGLAALQLARSRGALVLATAGSPEKRALLRLLGAEAVFDSRSLQFAEGVMDATAGRGVDMVLNSLSGEAMERTLDCMAAFGRFIELGKRDFYANGRIGLRPLRRNVSYHGVDLDAMLAARPESAAPLLAALADGLSSGDIVPLPHTLFEASDVVAAFRLMQRSGHVGKIVVSAPAPAPSRRARPPLARHDGAWLITGGTSGFGLALAERLAERGAGALWLVSRSGIVRDESALRRLRAAGTQVECVACDVTDAEAVRSVLGRIREEGPPLRGLAHAATVLDDALFGDVDEERLVAAMGPKLTGATLLDRLTQDLALDHFLLFSSVAALFGNPGQTAYAAANGALEALARGRHAAGRPALAVQWGPIADTGLLAGDAATQALLERRGAGMMTSAEALDRLERVIESGPDDAVIAIAPMRWGGLVPDAPLVGGPLFERVDRSALVAGTASGLDALRAAIEGLDETAALGKLVTVFRGEAATILRQPAEEIDPERPLADLGFDSLMAVELKLSTEEKFGLVLPAFTLSEGATIGSLSARVLADLRRGDRDTVGEEEAHARRHLGTEMADSLLSQIDGTPDRRRGAEQP